MRIIVGGDKIEYPDKVTTCTVEVNTVNIHLNSVMSTEGARYMNNNLKDFYLNTPMERFEYAKLKVEYIPEETMTKHNLWDFVHEGYVYIEIRKGMYGLSQAGCLANNLLKKKILPTVITNVSTYQACGGVSPTQSTSHYGWMISAFPKRIKKTPQPLLVAFKGEGYELTVD